MKPADLATELALLELIKSEGESQPDALLKDRMLLIAVSAAYGTNYASVKLLGEWLNSPAEAATLRFGIAAAALLPALIVLAARDRRFVSWPLARDGLAVGVCFAAGYAVQAAALQTSQAGVQAFLLSLTVVVCPLLEWIGSRQPPAPRVWVAATLAAAGVCILEGGNLAAGPSAGDALGLLQPLFFGSGFVLLAKAMCRHRKGASDLATPMALTAWEMIAITPLAFSWLVATSEPGASAAAVGTDTLAQLGALAHAGDGAGEGLATLAPFAALLWTGIVTSAGCCVAEAKALGTLSSSDATVIFATEPLWAVLFAFLWLGETPGLATAAGGVLVIGACVVSSADESTLREALGQEARERALKRAEPYLPFGFLPRLLLKA